MKILIVGAGIGGLTTAIALSRAGHELTLVERQAEPQPLGAGIILAPNALHALRSIGVEASSWGQPLGRFDIVTSAGRRLQRLEPQKIEPEFGAACAFTRPALHECLQAAGLGEVRVHYGLDVVPQLTIDRAGIHATLAANERSTFDLLIGADGLRSAVRERFVASARIRYSGVTCWRGLTSNPGFDGAVEAWGGDARIGVVPLRKNELYYYLVVTARERAAALEWPHAFRSRFAVFDEWPMMRGFLDSLREAPPLHHDLCELERPIWGRERVLLLGDAAHGMTPNQGQGAAMAIEDAIALERAIRPGLQGAVDRYLESRHRRVRRVQLDSRRLGTVAHWRAPVAVGLRNLMLRALPQWAGDSQYRRLIGPGLELVRSP